MKQVLKIFLFITVFTIFLNSCFGPGVKDFSIELTDNYSVFRTSAHNIIITPNDGWNDEIAIIPSKVIKVNVYKDFIVAEREGLKNRLLNSLEAYNTPDEKVKDYWILNTSKNYVIGTLNFDNFKNKLDSLNIPRDIKLIDVYEY